jgi:suppressor of ftsI
MSEETHVSVGMQEVKFRSFLTMGTIGVFAAIIFGLLYLFVLAPSAPGSGAGWFLFSFATGITMIVMPCTLPLAFVIVPLSMGKGIAKGLGIALAFGIGIAITQSLYGVIAALIGNLALGTLGAPLEVVKNWVYLVAGTFALLFALGEIGLIKVRMPTYTGAAPAFIQRRQDVVKALMLGLFLGNIGIGCPHPATPLLLIEAASSGNVVYGWLLFMTHAIGRILPLLLLSFLGILGVNGLSWLMSRKEAVERATGWAMVFVAGFILTLGLFTHYWWVNSGIHSVLERVTNEQYFNNWFNTALNTSVAHEHGFEVGTGMFGLPLWLGNWFLVLVWIVPMWWWWLRKRRALLQSPAFKLREIESRIDRLERSRRDLEEVIKLDDTEADFDLSAQRSQIDALEKARRDAEEHVQFGESGILKEPIARTYEQKVLGMQRNYLALLSLTLALVFIYFMPKNFYLLSQVGGGHDDGHGDAHTVSSQTSANLGTPRSTDTTNLPKAVPSPFVTLKNGDTYAMTASYVKKTIANRTLRMMAYNGSIPGPFISAPQGSTVTIQFTNNTDIDQTIHPHGLRLENSYDGTPGVTQDVVKPGQSFSYKISFPDANVAWYHPHTRDDIGQELGLYGTYFVEPEDLSFYSPVNRTVPLVVDDILLTDKTTAPFYDAFTSHALLGRFGNTYLVNGEENFALPVKKGEVIRFYVTNVSNTRVYNLRIPGAEVKVVGSDQGLFENEYRADTMLVSPAERLIVEVFFKDTGTYRLVNQTPNGQTLLATFAVSNENVSQSYVSAFRTLRTNNLDQDIFSRIRSLGGIPPDKRLLLSVEATGIDHSTHAHGSDTTQGGAHTMPDGTVMMSDGSMPQSGKVKRGVDALQWDDIGNTDAKNTTKNVTWKLIDQDTGKANANIDLASWTFKTGSLVKIRITSDMMAAHVMQHPIHLHGQRFVELTRNGTLNTNMVWKDTLLVLPGDVVDIVVDMANTGNWMLHCHIVEHLHAGMMMSFRVEDPNGSAEGDGYRTSKNGTAVSHAYTNGTTTPTPSLLTGANNTAFRFDSPINNGGFKIKSETTRFTQNVLSYAPLTFFDANGTHTALSSSVPNPLKVTFVRSDNTAIIETYPGKKDFVISTSTSNHVDIPGMPAHTHSLLPLIHVAYADAGHPHDPTLMAQAPKTYSVPVVFSTTGNYRAFVEFIPAGENTYRTASFDVVVTTSGFTIDSYGMSPRTKWWTLLLISLLLMAPLSFIVKRYVNNAGRAT